MENEITQLFRDAAKRRLAQLCSRLEECVGRLTEEQVWARGSENENAVGNLMLHLAGNVRQWILSGVGRQPDHRQRDLEFSSRGDIGKQEMAARLRATVDEAAELIGNLTPQQLVERRTIQGYEVSVLEAVFHVTEHFAQHTAQIIFAAKMLTQEDMGFYKHLGSAAAQMHKEKTP